MVDLYDPDLQIAERHHLEKLANPEASAKHGTLEGLNRMGAIWVCAARGIDAIPVALPPGIVGGKLDIQLRALNSQLWRLYEQFAIPAAFANELCLSSESRPCGGIGADPAWTLGGRDFFIPPPHRGWANKNHRMAGPLEGGNPKSAMVDI